MIAFEGANPVGGTADLAVSTLTLAEMSMGLVGRRSNLARTRRMQHLHWIEEAATALDFDSNCAKAYESICAATIQVGRKVRGSRSLDLLIAATSLAYELPLYTRNSSDFRGLEYLIEIVDLA